MSETWGPRGRPERCDPVNPERPRKSIEDALGTMFGIFILALIIAGAVLWWVR